MKKQRFDAPQPAADAQEEAAMPYPPRAKSSPTSSVANKHTAQLMAIDGVEGIGVGQDPIGNETIVVYVRDQETAKCVPKELDGLKVQIKVTGTIEAL